MKYSGIGGQAVIEGVMMKGSSQYAVSVRKPDGEIEVKVENYKSLKERYAIANVPVIRGIFVFAESLKMGMGTLNYSASFWEEEEKENSKEKQNTNDILMGLMLVIAIVLAIGLFVLLPFFISEQLSRIIPSIQLRGLIEGVIRVAIFVAYVKAISLMEDIRRVFMYHGAEHKCINCIENGLELTVENAQKQTMVHKRCGTSFMLVVMLVSILLFMFISVPNIWIRMVLRILLIPIIAGVSYEFISLAGKSENSLVNVLSKPGLWLQSLTTKEPEDAMLEVAIRSVEAVFDWRDFLAHYEEKESKEETHTEEFEVVDVEDENDEILQALDRYFDDAPSEEKEQMTEAEMSE